MLQNSVVFGVPNGSKAVHSLLLAGMVLGHLLPFYPGMRRLQDMHGDAREGRSPGLSTHGRKSPSPARSEALFHPHNNLVTVSNEEYDDASIFPLPLP